MNKPGLRQSINDMCKSCIYDSRAAGNWKQQVTICTSFECPLYPVRPVSREPIPLSVIVWYGLDLAVFQGQDVRFTSEATPGQGGEDKDENEAEKRPICVFT